MKTLLSLLIVAIAAANLHAAPLPPPAPTHADVSYGPSPQQILDIYLPPKGSGPFPVIVWFGGLWKPAKHPVQLNLFSPERIAVVAVEMRTMNEAMADKVADPVSYVMKTMLVGRCSSCGCTRRSGTLCLIGSPSAAVRKGHFRLFMLVAPPTGRTPLPPIPSSVFRQKRRALPPIAANRALIQNECKNGYPV